MHKGWFVLFLILAACSVARAQTADQLSLRFGPLTGYTLVSNYIIMIPKFDVDGQVCEVSIQRQIDTGNEVVPYIEPFLIKKMVDDVVSAEDRGKSLNGQAWEGHAVSSGAITTIKYDFENVSISVVQTSKDSTSEPIAILIKWNKRSCEVHYDEKNPRTPFNLLPGYKIKSVNGFEGGSGGTIWREGGPSINFVEGDFYSQREVDSVPQDQVVWRRDEKIGDREFISIYTRSDELVMSLGGHHHPAADFRAKIRNQLELAEVLLMFVSYDPFHGYKADPSAIVKVKTKK
jgi:hypothetical protein